MVRAHLSRMAVPGTRSASRMTGPLLRVVSKEKDAEQTDRAVLYERPDLSVSLDGEWFVARCHYCRHQVKIRTVRVYLEHCLTEWWSKGQEHRCVRGSIKKVVWEHVRD
jgi:hypothetical protein